MKCCLGIDVGGTSVKMGLFRYDGNILDKWEITTRTQNQGEAILGDISKSIKEKVEEHKIPKEDILGIGMGIPAPVTGDGIVYQTANLGWGYKEVKREMEEFTGYPVFVANDANVAALGEMWLGGGRGHKNLVVVTLGTGVGGAIIVGGECVVGSHGGAGEIGHITVNYDETETCGCGRCGCLEQYASATGIARLARRRLKADDTPSILREEKRVTAKDVFDAVKEGDPVAGEIASEFGRYLGYALANVAAACDPGVIVIGGGVSKAGPALLGFIERPFRERAYISNMNTAFALAQLGNDAGICGAAKLVLK